MKSYLLYFLAILIWTASIPFAYHLVPDTFINSSREPSDESDTGESSSHKPVIDYVSLYENKSGSILNIPLEDYVKGVLSAEMPENTPMEAMKAMAVAVRTYALYHSDHKDKSAEHSEADLCDDVSHCRAFTLNFTEEAIEAANATEGEAVYYNNEYINAVFHISSAVRTENAYDAFGVEVPYLRSVETPDKDDINDFYDNREFTKKEFYDNIAEYGIELDESTEHSSWITDITYTEGGRIKYIYFGSRTITGSEFMKLFKLQSANIKINTGSGGYIFTTEGIGHGVGISQYGAYIMASEGASYREILKHYYTGVLII